MKQITATKAIPPVTVIYRFDGRFIYLKCGNMQYASQIIANIKARGGIILQGTKTNFMQINIFGNNDFIKIGNNEINVNESKSEEIETILINFFLMNLKKAGFETKLEDI